METPDKPCLICGKVVRGTMPQAEPETPPKGIVPRFRIGDDVRLKHDKYLTGKVEEISIRFEKKKGEPEYLDISYRVNYFVGHRETLWYPEEDLKSGMGR